METDGQEKRRHQRVKLPYMMKFRSVQPGTNKNWDAVTPVNMSESGICFLTMEEFAVGTDIEFYVSNPLSDEKLVYECKVLRCKKAKARSVLFETVVTIENMSEEAKEVYTKLLNAFSNEITRRQLGL